MELKATQQSRRDEMKPQRHFLGDRHVDKLAHWPAIYRTDSGAIIRVRDIRNGMESKSENDKEHGMLLTRIVSPA